MKTIIIDFFNLKIIHIVFTYRVGFLPAEAAAFPAFFFKTTEMTPLHGWRFLPWQNS